MCTICSLDKDHDKKNCYCPRCPDAEANTEPCSVCADINCVDRYCTAVEHFELGGKLFCQLCVEAEYDFKFNTWQFGMYCDIHNAEHKSNRVNYAAS